MTAQEGKPSSGIFKVISWIVTLLLPVVIILTAVRILLTPLFLRIEYSLPGFPPDRYGFTMQDRLYWAPYAVDYLLNDAGIEYLSDLRFLDGSPLYNERELGHMVDVKNVVQAALKAWLAGLAALALLGIWAWFGKWWSLYLRGLSRGGWLTVAVIGAALVVVVLSFGLIFVAFHNVFFEPGTWTFFYSDTLIRLFPERFWRDVFLWVGAISLAGGLGFGFAFRRR
jgi:integral membrane protein (TIGR01906 family)